MKKIAFVTPWFGMDIPGGAEAETRELAIHLNNAGLEVEIITTCVKEFTADWTKNYYNEGEYREGGLLVRRFAADERDKDAFDAVNIKLMNNFSITEEEEEVFNKNMINSQALYNYIKKHSEDYSFFIFIPYMFGTTFYGCQICPEKSILIPCFHDESYFYMKSFNKVFSNVAGIIYNARPEMDLTVKHYPLKDNVRQIVMGIGMNTDQQGDASRFRKKYNINNPFILYAGRKDKGKNVDTLIQYFAEFKKRNQAYNNLKLVMIGGGEIAIPEEVRDEIEELGFVDIQDKYDAYEAAALLCQPSKHESFSFVIMESWLACRPVIVADQCEVTKNFCIESNGGLWFKDYYEFEGALIYLLENITEAAAMGENGKEYVNKSFSWDVIVDRYKSFLAEILRTN